MFRFIIAITFLGIISLAQIQKSGNLQTHIDSIITNMPDVVGGNEYQHPTIEQLSNWGEIIDSILATNYADAHSLASSLSYRITEFIDNSVSPNKTYYVLQNNPNGTNYWGTYIFNPAPDRAQLVIQSPHPKKDFNTGKQGFFVFREVGARSFFLSGTSRCSSTDTTTCDGRTSVCNGSNILEAYKISDQAHTTTGTFQRTTERLFNANNQLIFIQLHGFGKGESDPYVIMSNGVQDDTPPDDYLSDLKDNLLIEDDSLTFKIAHIDTTWDRLLGTTNTQGRFINGSGDPCDDNATINTGQFLHLEQEKTKLRDNQTGWAKMANAIAATFPEVSLPVELTSFEGYLTEDRILLEWETATEINNYGFEVQKSEDRIQNSEESWEAIGFVHGHGTTNSPKYYEFTDSELPYSEEVRYRLKQIDNDGTFDYSKIVTVDLTTITDIDDELIYEFTLDQNYPNPFNPSTTIRFTVPNVGTSRDLSLQTSLIVYDILGREIAILLNEKLNSGNYEVTFDASHLTSGMYLYKLIHGNFEATKKLLFVK
ncbi:MAG: T9SS type A sorting domain-containing protein [Melioribacteraceae bacterium]|nr:MAG: T9SS type A sorting domain-containing protein [Melioribacteraceae bacterium]